MFQRLASVVGLRSTSLETRVKAVVLGLIVFSVMITVSRQFVGTLSLVREPFVDEILVYESRFGPLKEVLPQRTVVGFVTDSTNPNEVERRQRLVSYALSPIAIDFQSNWPVVIGDFPRPADVSRQLGPNLQIRRDFGRGALLLERDQ